MLDNQWYVILESKQVKQDKLLGIKRLNKNIVLYRDDSGQVICMEDKCSHRGVKLSIGSVSNNCVTCPFHGFTFNSSGECIEIPANGKSSSVSKRFNVRTYPIYETNGFVFMYNGQEPSGVPSYFEGLENLRYKTTYSEWNTHYSRAVENQLDVIHLPFVHSKTIGRGNKTLVNGPVTVADEEKMTIYVYNQVDVGQKPLKASEMTELEKYFKLKFIMPNLWMNRISDGLVIVAGFVPVDEENSIIYLRTYQNFVSVPVIRNLVLNIMSRFNLKVLNEDKRVVLTQTPINTHLDIKENLIAGDLPIGQYRRMVKASDSKYKKEEASN